jgi:Ulp1 family protease
MIVERSQKEPGLPKVYATNTFFYPKLLQSGLKKNSNFVHHVSHFSWQLEKRSQLVDKRFLFCAEFKCSWRK